MSIVLSDKGFTMYSIVVPSGAPASERYAAEEFSNTLCEITGIYFPIIFESRHLDKLKNCIFIGYGAGAEKLGIIPDPSLGGEGYIIKTIGDNLIIAGGNTRGTLYGVYAFLEEVLGCRWYTPTEKHIPKRDKIIIKDLDIRYKPVLEYREAYYGNGFQGDWSCRNRLNGNSHQLYSKHGGRVKYSKHFVHTFNALVPVEKYFDTNPEYFSFVNGRRIKEETQLCMTNPDVLRISIEKVRQWIEEDPEATIFSISQNDWYNPCQCESCNAIDQAEGSYAGTLIWFVNKIAETIEKDYPYVLIDTLAYQHTRPAPKNIRPRSNVCVRLCSIECCFAHPLEKCDVAPAPFTNRVKEGASFQKDLGDWARICDRLYIWDYVTNFSHYCMSFPNLNVLQPNIKFLTENNVKGIFEQGTYAIGGGADFNELRTWILAKLLWDPGYDVKKGTDEFMHAFYGHAAPPLLKYIEMLHEKVEKENIHFGIFSVHTIGYLNKDVLAVADKLFEEAESLTDNEKILWRVRRARLAIRYAYLAFDVSSGIIDKDTVECFFEDVTKFGLTRICEWRTLEEDKELIYQGKLRTW